MEDNKITSFLTRIGSELSNHRMVMERSAAQLTPNFNLFEVCGIDWLNEIRMTGLITQFLDPNSNHGQGGNFLAEFCRRIGVSEANFGMSGLISACVTDNNTTIMEIQIF